MADATPRTKIVTPKGIAIFPKLNAPDTFKNSTTYNVRVKFDATLPEVQALINVITEAHTAALPYAQALLQERIDTAKVPAKKGEARKKLADLELAPMPVKAVLDEDGNETDFVEIRFKANAEFKGKDGEVVQTVIRLVDAKKAPIDPKKTNIGGGSVIRVSAVMSPYYMESTNKAGVSFRMNAVQVVELKTYGGGDDGFDEEEGYQAAEEAAGADDF